jgi:tetratricopeptide (TPR) repeat protein
MTKVAKFAAALAMTASIVALGATSADAQRRNRGEAAATPATPPVSRGFITAYQPVNTAITASDWATADAGLAALKAAATSPYETYLAWQTDFRISTGMANAARQLAAVDGMIDSGGAPEADAQRLNTAGGQLAYQARDYAKAALRLTRAGEIGPLADDVQVMRIDAFFRSGATDQGLTEGRALMAASRAAGRAVPDRIYNTLAVALQEAGRNAELTQILGERLSAYPTQANFRSAVLSYMQTAPENRGRSIDALRLMFEAQAMDDRRFYLEHVGNLIEDALPNEAINVIRAGRAAGRIPATDTSFNEYEASQRAKLAEDRASIPGTERRASSAPDARLSTVVGDAYLSYEDWAAAERLYLQALTKTGVDAQLVNTRLGIARYHAGNMTGALEALAQVQGDRAPIARMWEALIRSRQTPTAAPAAPAAAPTTGG